MTLTVVIRTSHHLVALDAMTRTRLPGRGVFTLRRTTTVRRIRR
ncbi:hypothetical protein [Geodermatophilus ruber]|uniref:Uncharacterized protein n=1 Tax=Geodermatophilus ruber TaxID=504800 RepID=A0A1I4C0C0_9ACTN|nr:hypothetical protein [Geodermatophilus ruber]SFK74502.1 hypothetical protein SAMN04488085_103284 [Geodermatophilus ruber]